MLSVFMGHGLSTLLHSGQQRTSALPVYGSRPPAAGRAAVHVRAPAPSSHEQVSWRYTYVS